MKRPTLLVSLLVGLLALSSTGMRDVPVAQSKSSAVFLRYHYAPHETLTYTFRERITDTSAAASTAPVTTTTALVTYRQRLRVAHVSALGAATAEVSESTHTITTTTGARSMVATQPGQATSVMDLYPDGRIYIQALRSTSAGNAGHVPVFPARSVAPGAQWVRRVTHNLGRFFVTPPVITITEHLTFTGYGVVNGERVAEIAIAVKAQRSGEAPPGSVWPKAPVTTTYTATSTLSIGLSSGYIVRSVEDSATTVREASGKRSVAPGGWFTLATHSAMRHI